MSTSREANLVLDLLCHDGRKDRYITRDSQGRLQTSVHGSTPTHLHVGTSAQPTPTLANWLIEQMDSRLLQSQLKRQLLYGSSV